MRIKKEAWYGFDHAKVAEMFEGNLTFVNEFCINDEYRPVAVYRAAKPNRKKGHKTYMLLQMETDPVTQKRRGLVRGMSAKDMDKQKYSAAVHCLACDTVIYSMNRHHFNRCGCDNDTFVDGGKDYIRSGGKDLRKTKVVRLNLLTDAISAYRDK